MMNSNHGRNFNDIGFEISITITAKENKFPYVTYLGHKLISP